MPVNGARRRVQCRDGVACRVPRGAASGVCCPLPHPIPIAPPLVPAQVINSAVFNAGFLIGGDHFDYQKISRERHPDKFVWRDRFTALCSEYGLKPAAVCVQFSFLFPQVVSVALNTTKPSRVQSNVELAEAPIPASFWARLKDEGLTSVGPR